ncbi:MAG: putative colanic acid biosynthesis acetyltransferase [Methylococcaceae bacterium]
MGAYSCLSEDVDCYCVDRITLGKNAIVSQYSYLCTASHDYDDSSFPLVIAPINIEDKAWVATDVFIGPGVTVKEGAVVGARSSVFKDIDSWIVVGGNPAKFIKRRKLMS